MDTNDVRRALPPKDPEAESSLEGTAGTQELILQFQAGNEGALDRIWARYVPRLRRWAHGRLPTASRNVTNTDDLVQDAFVRSLTRLRTLELQGPHSLFAYLKTIMLNQIRDYARAGGRRPKQELLEPDEHQNRDPSPLEQVLGTEVLERYQAALATLSDEDQEIVLAFVELRCTDKELAELLEKPSADAARMARGRALARLARAMETPPEGPVRSGPPGRSQ
jgi:RNA polymerase sigma-70 factor (ECF subfamily)